MILEYVYSTFRCIYSVAIRWRKSYHCSYFLYQSLNAVDASLYIMFNFGACPEFSNVSYNKSYFRNMSASLLVLMGSTKISFVSYAYSTNMYWIPLSLVTGKRPVKYVYTFPVSGFSRTIVENTKLLFPSLWGKIYVSVSSASYSLFVYLLIFLVWSKCPKRFLVLVDLQKIIMKWGLYMLQSFHYL